MDWRILLIGGNSGSGKTLLAQDLARKIKASAVQVDDVRLAIQSVTDHENHPSLHAFLNSSSLPLSTDEYFRSLVGVAEAIEPALRIIMSHHLVVESSGPIILEGDGILPRLGEPDYLSQFEEFHDIHAKEGIRAIFIIESDKEALHESVIDRVRGIQNKLSISTNLHVLGSMKYGAFLKKSAIDHGIPWVASRPFNTLSERVYSLIES